MKIWHRTLGIAVVTGITACSAPPSPGERGAGDHPATDSVLHAASTPKNAVTGPVPPRIARGPRLASSGMGLLSPFSPERASPSIIFPWPPFCFPGRDCSVGGPYKVTGQSGDPFGTKGEAETAVATTGSGNLVAAFNDFSGLVADGSGNIRSGTSLMGYSVSTDGGRSWSYRGVVPTDATSHGYYQHAYPVLWGDPAIVASKTEANTVYMSNLGVPAERYPAAGIDPDNLENALNGACIAKSTDGGWTFSLYECIQLGSAFYDGSSMAAGPNGEIYVAYRNVTNNQIDVYAKTSPRYGFEKLNYSPISGTVWDHPRLQVDPANGDLYVMAKTSGGLNLAFYRAGTFMREVTVATPFRPAFLPFTNGHTRLGPQYSFAIGNGLSVTECDPSYPECTYWDDSASIRFAFTEYAPNGRVVVMGGGCGRELLSCFVADEWGTTETSHPGMAGTQFNPLVSAVWDPSRRQPLFELSYLTTPSDGSMASFAIVHTEMPYSDGGDGALATSPLVARDGLPVCPRVDPKFPDDGYIGDYDELHPVGAPGGNLSQAFTRTFTDMTAGCDESATPPRISQHVSNLIFRSRAVQ